MKTIILILLLAISLIHAERIPITNIKSILFNADNIILLYNGLLNSPDSRIVCNVWIDYDSKDIDINNVTRCYSNKYLIMWTDIRCNINDNHEILQDSCAIVIEPKLVSPTPNFLYDISMMRLGEIPDRQLVVYNEYELGIQVFTNYLLCNDNFVNVITPLLTSIIHLFESSSITTQSNI